MKKDIAIEVNNLGKKYKIGKKERYLTLRDSLTNMVKLPYELITGKTSLKKQEFWALKNVSFEVKRGEVLGIIGKNGAGKSTLLKILSRITEPTTGTITLKGRVSSLLEVGTGFNLELTGRENIYLNAAILGMRRREINKKFNNIVDFSGVEKFLNTPVKRYSSGMRVRLAFSVAAHLESEILLIDEVLAVGDAEFQKRCLGKMDEISKKQGRTILFVSHNMQAVEGLCNKAILLNQGRIIKTGNTNLVIDSYLKEFSEDKLSQKWSWKNAPGNKFVKVKKIEVKPLRKNRKEAIKVTTPLEIIFEFWYLKEDGKINLSMRFNKITGECVFNSPSCSKKVKKGLVRSICHIPGNLLNDGIYHINMMVVEDSKGIFYLREGCNFEVKDIKRRGRWFGKWPGAVRPKLKWTIN